MITSSAETVKIIINTKITDSNIDTLIATVYVYIIEEKSK